MTSLLPEPASSWLGWVLARAGLRNSQLDHRYVSKYLGGWRALCICLHFWRPAIEAPQPRCKHNCVLITDIRAHRRVVAPHHFLCHPWYHLAFWWQLFAFSPAHPMSKNKHPNKNCHWTLHTSQAVPHMLISLLTVHTLHFQRVFAAPAVMYLAAAYLHQWFASGTLLQSKQRLKAHGRQGLRNTKRLVIGKAKIKPKLS